MEIRKIDIWMIVFILSVYTTVNIFRSMPDAFIVENTILVGVLFALLIISYFLGIVVALSSSAVVLFFYGTYSLYRTFLLGYSVEYHVYFWIIVIPLMSVAVAFIGTGIRSVQKTNIQLKDDYSEAVTVNTETGLFNEKVFFSTLNQFLSLHKRHHIPLSILLIKVKYKDDIKSIIGENSLSYIKEEIAAQLVNQTRQEDCCYIMDDGWTFALILFADHSGTDCTKRRIKENVTTIKVKKYNKFTEIRISLIIGRAFFDKNHHDVISLKEAAERDMEFDA